MAEYLVPLTASVDQIHHQLPPGLTLVQNPDSLLCTIEVGEESTLSAQDLLTADAVLAAANDKIYQFKAGRLYSDTPVGVALASLNPLLGPDLVKQHIDLRFATQGMDRARQGIQLLDADIYHIKLLHRAVFFLIAELKKGMDAVTALSFASRRTEDSEIQTALSSFFSTKCTAWQAKTLTAVAVADFAEILQLSPATLANTEFISSLYFAEEESDGSVFGEESDLAKGLSKSVPDFQFGIERGCTLPDSLKKAWGHPQLFKKFLGKLGRPAFFVACTRETGWIWQIGQPIDSANGSLTLSDSAFLLVDHKGNICGGYGIVSGLWKKGDINTLYVRGIGELELWYPLSCFFDVLLKTVQAMTLRRGMAHPCDANLSSRAAFLRLEHVKFNREEALTAGEPNSDKRMVIRMFLKNCYQTYVLETKLTEEQSLRFYLGLEVDPAVVFLVTLLGTQDQLGDEFSDHKIASQTLLAEKRTLQQVMKDAELLAAPFFAE
ncbi:UNVERIFIED_CONTAM: hypothetical protein HDU68_005618, partial [Siphonaria sp. JEL0065]